MIYLEAGKEFSLQISDMKVGRLKVPASWALSWISSRPPEGMEAQEDTVVIGSQLLRIPLGDLQASLSLDGFRTEQGKGLCAGERSGRGAAGIFAEKSGRADWEICSQALGSACRNFVQNRGF